MQENLFEKLLNQYDADLKETIPEIATGKFYDNVVLNDLDPEIELQITLTDKIIFIVLILIVRYGALYITNNLIDYDNITGIKRSITYYTIAYISIIVILIIIINIDVFRLRMIFNYLNMHINSINIYSHIILAIIIGYLVYLLIININIEREPTKLSKHEKIKLKNKLNILTLIIIVFLALLVLII